MPSSHDALQDVRHGLRNSCKLHAGGAETVWGYTCVHLSREGPDDWEAPAEEVDDRFLGDAQIW